MIRYYFKAIKRQEIWLLTNAMRELAIASQDGGAVRSVVLLVLLFEHAEFDGVLVDGTEEVYHLVGGTEGN